MNWKKTLKITGIVILSLVLLAIIANIAINIIIKKQLPNIIKEKNDTAYNFEYEDMNFSVFNNSLSVEKVKVTPKKNVSIRKDIDFLGEVGSISVTGVNFYELLTKKNLKAYTITITEPNITVFKPEVRDTLKSESKLTSSIDIDKITVKKANLKIMSNGGDSLFNQVHNLNAEIDGIHMGEYTAGKDIPFTYQNYEFSIDSVYTKMNDFQYVKSDAILIDKDNFDMTNLRIYPSINSKTFKKNLTDSNTRLNLQVPKVNLKGTDWGYDKLDFYVKVNQINIDSINFNILDQKKQTVFQQAKKDAEKIIQPIIPFRVDVGEINIKKSSFNSLGILDVNNVNINIKGISNRVKERLYINEFNLNKPQFVHVPKKSDKDRSNNEPSPLNDKIIIHKLNVKDANYVLKDKSGKTNQLTVQKFNLTLNNINVDDKTVKEKIPFTYENPKLTTGKIHYNTGENYDIYTNGIEISEHNAMVENLQMKPKHSRKVFNSKLKFGTDHYNITTGKLLFKNMDWGFNAKDVFFLKFREVVLNNIDASIYRNASIPNEIKVNKMYSQKLRELKIGLDVSVLKIVNSKLTYEEETDTSNAPGKLTFSNFNITARNIYSGQGRSSGPQTTIDVSTNFMNSAKLIANWSFNIMNKSEHFKINGEINNFPALAMNPFLKPYMKVSASGTIDKMRFDFNGNNSVCTGTFGMNYKDLKMTLYQKDGKKERKLLSEVGNLFLRDDTKGGVLTTEIKPVERKKDCSFFNFLWLSIMQGLKQTVI